MRILSSLSREGVLRVELSETVGVTGAALWQSATIEELAHCGTNRIELRLQAGCKAVQLAGLMIEMLGACCKRIRIPLADLLAISGWCVLTTICEQLTRSLTVECRDDGLGA